jgi:hypothetical protein
MNHASTRRQFPRVTANWNGACADDSLLTAFAANAVEY